MKGEAFRFPIIVPLVSVLPTMYVLFHESDFFGILCEMFFKFSITLKFVIHIVGNTECSRRVAFASMRSACNNLYPTIEMCPLRP